MCVGDAVKLCRLQGRVGRYVKVSGNYAVGTGDPLKRGQTLSLLSYNIITSTRVIERLSLYYCTKRKRFFNFRSLIWQQGPPLSHVPRVSLSASSEPLPVPDHDGSAKTYPEKIHTIVNHISQLTLLETAQLNELLKVTLIPLS